MLERGVILKGYRIDGVLGVGGMGVVYEATQLSLERTVALKLIAAELGADPGFRERFRREGMIQAAIDHPHIVPVYEAGESDHGLFIAMRLIRGRNLKDLILAGDLDPQRTTTLLTQVAGALDSAHEVGLIHRDIKPYNILVDIRRDHAYLADFGVTKARSRPNLTKTGQMVGTLDYMAPEQIMGQPATERTDIYALGAVVYECFTGTVPFQRETDGAVLYAHLSEPVPAVQSVRGDLPSGLDGVIGKAMAKKPEERYEMATELLRDVDGAVREGLGASTVYAPVRETEVATAPPTEVPAADTGVAADAATAAPAANETVLAPPGPATPPPETVLAPPGPATPPPETFPPGPATPPPATEAPATEETVLAAQAAETAAPVGAAAAAVGLRAGDTPVTVPGAAEASAPARPEVAAPPRPAARAPRTGLIAVGAAVAVIALAVVGFLVGRSTGGGGTKEATPPPSSGSATAGKVTLPILTDWRRLTKAPQLPGLRLANPLPLSPKVTRDAGLVAGAVAPAWPTFLPASFRKLVPESALNGRDVVRLGDLEGLRYAALKPKGFDGTMTLYVIPQEKKATTTVACFAKTGSAGAGGGVLSDCSTITAAISVDGAKSYELQPQRSYASSVNAALGTVNKSRSANIRKMQNASSAATQAAAARSIAAAYSKAAKQMQGAKTTPYVDPVNDDLVTALRSAGSAYQALASAASAKSSSRYNAARSRVSAREKAVRNAVAALKPLGYQIG